LRHQLRDVPRVAGGVRALARAFREVLLGEALHRIAKRILLGAEAEIHAHSFMATSASTATAPSALTISGLISASARGRPDRSARRDTAATAFASARTSPRGRLR